uniref:IS21 family transposase n=1 Tax=Mesorhizobium sp. L-8-3 TaxID=2744522 RepID=UPI001FD3F8DB
MLRLRACGWGVKRIARQLGCSHHTVKAYVAADGVKPFSRLSGQNGSTALRAGCARGSFGIAAMRMWCARTCCPRRGWRSAGERCSGRCSVTVRRRRPRRWRRRGSRRRRADSCRSTSASVWSRSAAPRSAFMFVATLGHSRRLHVRAFRAEKQEHWFGGLERAFTSFGGVPEEVLMDNPRALVVRHDAVSRSVQFNDKLIAFAKHWGFCPRACAPYRARTKGKTESGVGYVKKNAIAGHCFASWEAFEAHLGRWEREVANVRIHGTTGEAPTARFERDEAHRLKPLGGRAGFGSLRELTRIVGNDCAVEIDTNSYSVPWRLIGERVAVTVAAGEVRIRHGAREVAVHKQSQGRRLRVVDPAHLDGVAGRDGAVRRVQIGSPTLPTSSPPPSLLRPLAEYEAAIGGSF